MTEAANKVMVTGCLGFIGSHLTEALLADGTFVVGIDALAPTYDTAGRRGVLSTLAKLDEFEFIEGDLNDVDLSPHVKDVDVVYHLAARPGVRASWADFRRVSEANVLGTQRVLDALTGAPNTQLVFASSSSVYGRSETFPTREDAPLGPISPYGVTKAACEALIGAYSTQFGVRAASLRYFTVFGPRQRTDMAFTRWIRAGLRGEPLPLFGDGTAVRDFTYVADVVDATRRVAGLELEGHEIFNVAGGSPVSIREVLEYLGEVLERPLDIQQTARAKGDPDRTGGATDLIRERTGWEPKYDWKQGLSEQVEWLRGLSAERV